MAIIDSEASSDEATLTLPDILRPQADDAADGFRFLNSAGLERFLSFADLREEALRRAGRLISLGLERGDRAALVLNDEAEMALSFLAVVLAGLVPVLIAPRNVVRSAARGSESFHHILEDSGARLVITTQELSGLLAGRLHEVRSPNVLKVEQLVAETGAMTQRAGFEPIPVEPDALCFLQYTSGSTGRPKGTMITHRNLLANAKAILAGTRTMHGPHEHVVSWLPLYHDWGLIGFFLTPLLARVPTTLLSPNLFARRARIWLDVLHERRATLTGAPNFAFAFLLRRLKDVDVSHYDLSALRVLACGGEPIQHAAFLQFARRLAPAGLDGRCFLPCYGLAEATLAVTFHPSWHPTVFDAVDAVKLRRGMIAGAAPSAEARVLVSCGTPIARHQVEIVTSAHELCEEGQVGEIRVKGPSVASGYFGNRKASENPWQDGWLYTGDIGYMKDGHLYICGRVKDLIIVHGANYYPQDIEWTVGRMNEVRGRKVAAFAIEIAGAESFALVIEAPVADRERSDELRATVSEAVTREHGIVPAVVLMVPLGVIPLTTSGKIQRRRLREMYEAEELPGQRSIPEVSPTD